MDPSAAPRPSPIAGTWYPGKKDDLLRTVTAYLAAGARPEISTEVLGIIVPHAGYQYSGQTAAYAFNTLRGKAFELAVVLSPLHAAMREGLFTSSHSAYRTPLGDLPVSREAQAWLAEQCSEKGLPLYQIANDQEHSLEIELPFLQVIHPEPFTLLPLMVRDRNPGRLERLGSLLADLASRQPTVLIASTDLSHFYSERQAHQYDQHILSQMEALSPEGVLQAELDGTGFACGAPGVAAFLWAVKRMGAAHATLLHYTTSAERTGDTSSVVGYGALSVTA